MSTQGKIVTYTCFFSIIILFLYLGYSSISNIKPAKVDPETLHLARLIDSGKQINILALQLYETIDKSKDKNPYKIVNIKDSKGNIEELTHQDIVYNQIDKIQRLTEGKRVLIERFEDKEFSNKYKDAVIIYYKAADTVIDVCEDILNELDENELSSQLLPDYANYNIKLGNNGSKITNYILKANKSLKK
ncbi:MAG: hypothetical protein AB1782_04615 [Cyanobacteriota bacterium]